MDILGLSHEEERELFYWGFDGDDSKGRSEAEAAVVILERLAAGEDFSTVMDEEVDE